MKKSNRPTRASATLSTSRFSARLVKIPCSILIVATVFTFGNAFSADLQDIRTGFHRSYSRIVIEFDAPVKYSVLRNDETPSVTVEAFSNGRIAAFGAVEIEEEDPILRQVRYRRNGKRIAVTVLLNNPGVRIEHYTMRRPFRIVMDIFEQRTLDTGSGPEQTSSLPQRLADQGLPESERAKNADASSRLQQLDSGVSKTAKIPETLVARTAVQKSAIQTPPQTVSTENAAPHRRSVNKRKMLWLMGGAFLLLDVMLLILYLNRRRGKKALPKKHVPRAKRTAPARTAAQPESTQVDGKAFAELLKSALEHDGLKAVSATPPEEENNELEEINRAVKLDALIGSLSEVVNRPEEEPAPPAFEEIVRELDLVDAAGELTEEAARKQLIGRDGLEFMQNIKRLYLN